MALYRIRGEYSAKIIIIYFPARNRLSFCFNFYRSTVCSEWEIIFWPFFFYYCKIRFRIARITYQTVIPCAFGIDFPRRPLLILCLWVYVYGTVMENREGNGPCYLRTEGISKEQEQDLYKAYLNMAPSQTLKWMEAGKGPSEENVEIEGTEPYIVGGHTASGYWVDNNRATTIEGLYAAGDVAGGCPQKYVTGALAEGEIAAEAILEYLGNKDAETRGKGATEKQRDASGQAEEKTVTKITKDIEIAEDQKLSEIAEAKKAEYESHLNSPRSLMNAEQLEEAMQKIMDQYAGGIGTDYRYSETSLAKADEKIAALLPVVDTKEF